MSTTEARIAELEARVAELEEQWRLNDEIDRLAEIAVRDRLPLDRVMRLVLPALCSAVGADVAWVRTYDETLSLHDFLHATGEEGSLPIGFDELAEKSDGGAAVIRADGVTVVAQRIDVAGDAFGTAAVRIPDLLGDSAAARVRGLLHVFCEEIDNTLAAIAQARRKSQAIDAMSDALADPVLDHGLRRAIDILRANVPIDDMLLVFRHEDDTSTRTLQYKIIHDGVLAHDSMASPDPEVDAFVRARAFRWLEGDDAEIRERFGIRRYREEVLITGVRSARVLGRIVAATRHGELNTFDRDLLDRFADSLRQRIVDFNKEWKRLSTTFPREACERLLREERYHELYLTPRERECAVMFCDISGFTRVCERVLVRPEAIGRLIDIWSARVVEIIWETGGCFDKMVGDCAIGLWGPPFFERSPRELSLAAIDAACRIRELTRSLTTHEDLPELAGAAPLDVATGLHLCPLFVGVFGPDEDFTGFSAGMNNTARLQGQASAGEILCMEPLVAAAGDQTRFGEAREARAKNVEHPLRFRALRA